MKTTQGQKRSIHLVDFENLCNESLMTQDTAELVRASYLEQVGVEAMDQVVIATSRINALTAFMAWPGNRHLMRDGKDGADIEIAEVILTEHLAERFDTVYVASGDSGLAPFVSALSAQGVKTVVVSLPGSLGREAAMAASTVIRLQVSRTNSIQEAA